MPSNRSDDELVDAAARRERPLKVRVRCAQLGTLGERSHTFARTVAPLLEPSTHRPKVNVVGAGRHRPGVPVCTAARSSGGTH